ncbi:MAG: hypothetical protein ACRCVA_31920, partial [Phreatobacter sp.]
MITPISFYIVGSNQRTTAARSVGLSRAKGLHSYARMTLGCADVKPGSMSETAMQTALANLV